MFKFQQKNHENSLHFPFRPFSKQMDKKKNFRSQIKWNCKALFKAWKSSKICKLYTSIVGTYKVNLSMIGKMSGLSCFHYQKNSDFFPYKDKCEKWRKQLKIWNCIFWTTNEFFMNFCSVLSN